MLSFLYNVFITPVESVVEFIFYFMNKIFQDRPAYSIVFVSLVINLLILPLYKRADDMQSKERDKVKSMERWNKHIRKTFKGDERYMIQSAYYRIEGYKPFYAITGSLSLLFQIPFFIAAYHFLSNLELLNGVSFYKISDLGAPDGMLKIGALSINVLPILMTTINIISGVFYTKGFKLKDKLQLYIMALLFLVLLYKSPAGLVLYWTCNNLFSLGKNVFAKLGKYKRPALNVLSALAGTGLFAKLIMSRRLVVRRQFLIFALVMLISYVPLFLSVLTRINKNKKKSETVLLTAKEKTQLNHIFWLGALLNTIILGVMIPIALIQSSPVEFGTLVHDSPLSLLLYTVAVYVGFLLVWVGIFYAISNDRLKKIFAYGLWIISISSLINYYCFYGKFGTMDYEMIFVEAPVYNDLGKLINLVVLILIAVALYVVMKKWPKICKTVLPSLILMTVVLSAVNLYKTQRILIDEKYYEIKKDTTIRQTVPISKNAKNVMVIMLDRAISEYIPYICKEKPEIAKQFNDFVYYPNTLSFGGCTNFAIPAVFGGYEYTPAEIDKRVSEKLVDKHNESLQVLPVLFANNGYDVDVVDPSYANYKDNPDTSLYDGYENITGHITMNKFAEYAYHSEDEVIAQRKHIATYSLFRTAPVLLQNSIYDDGNYLSKPVDSKGSVFAYCAEAYATLDHFDEYTYVVDDNKNKFLLMTNMITHEPTYLETPAYEIGPDTEPFPLRKEITDQYVIDGKVLNMNEISSVQHYHVNVAAYKLLGRFFDHMKEEGVYDNTRIIIVSDHGWPVLQMDDIQINEETLVETFNPVLWIKDFAGSYDLDMGEVWYQEDAKIHICDTFMTNADVATLCTRGLIDNPINPFTGNPIDSKFKENEPLLVTSSRNSSVYKNNGYIFDTNDYPWFEFYGTQVRDLDNWKEIDEE